MRGVLHSIAIFWGCIGMLLFYMQSDFNYDPFSFSDAVYYIWEGALNVLLISCCVFPFRAAKKYWIIFGCFFAIRLIWQCVVFKIGYVPASGAYFIFSLFCADIICIISLILIEYNHKKE